MEPVSSARTSPTGCSPTGTRFARSTTSTSRCIRAASVPTTSTTRSSCRSATSAITRRCGARSTASKPSTTSRRPWESGSRCTRSSATRASTRSDRGRARGGAGQARDAVRKLVVASSMSIYGEGEYRSPRTAESGIAPGPRPESQLAAKQWEVLRRGGGQLERVPTRETKPLQPDVRLRHQQARPRGALPVGRRRVRDPGGRAALLQRLRPGQALSNPYTGVAAIFSSRLLNGQTAADLRGRPPVARLHPRPRHRPRDRARARSGTAPTATTINLGTGRATYGPRDGAGDRTRARRGDRAGGRRRQYRAGDIRHCFADTRLARGAARLRAQRSALDDGMRDLLEWLEGQEAVDAVDAARAALVARGLAR